MTVTYLCIFPPFLHMLSPKGVCLMTDNKSKSASFRNSYDDGNIPEIDLPNDCESVEPLPESTRPRKDGPGGDGDD